MDDNTALVLIVVALLAAGAVVTWIENRR